MSHSAVSNYCLLLFYMGKAEAQRQQTKMSKRRWGQGRDCLAQRSAVVCHNMFCLPVSCVQMLQMQGLVCYKTPAVTKHLVIAKMGFVPLSGPRHQEEATILNTVSCHHCRADPTPGAAGCLHRNKGIRGNEKLGKIKTGKRKLFFPH